MNSIAAKNLSINFVRKYQKYFLFALKLIITAGLTFYIINMVNFKEIFSAAANADYYLLTFAFLLSFLNLYLQYQKWKIICNSLLEEKNVKKIIFSLFYGFSAGVFTPGRIGEYFGRGIAFNDKPLIKITAATFIDKIFPLLIVILTGLLAGIIYLSNFNILGYNITVPISIAILLIFCFVQYFFSKKNINQFISKQESKFFKKLQQIFIKLSFLKKLDKRLSFKLIVISFLFYSCYLIQFAILFSAFSQDLSFLKYIWAAGLIMFVKTIIPQISIGEFGIREGVSIYFLTRMGDYASTAFNASIFLFLINLLFPAFVGLVLSYKKNND